MFQPLTRNHKLLTPIVILLAVFAIAVLGPGHFFGMDMKDNGKMSGCIFSGKAALCSMGITEHITRWQNLFAAIPTKTILALGIVALITLVLRERLSTLLSGQINLLKRFGGVNNNNVSILNPLRLAFSKGLLHPKIYNF